MHLIQRRNRNWSWVIYYSFRENVAQLWRILKDVQRTKRNSWEINCCWKIRQNQAMKQTVHVRFYFYSYFCNQKFTALLSQHVGQQCKEKNLVFEDSILLKELIPVTQRNMTFVDNFFLPKICLENLLLMMFYWCEEVAVNHNLTHHK